MKRNVTISDVANQAEVSKATVSRYLNGRFEKMSLETKEKIEKVIADLNYRPNKQAQSLKSKKSSLIGVVVSDISNMYSSLLLKGIGEVLGKKGYQMIIMDAANSVSQEKELLDKLIDQRVEGIILQASSRKAENYDFIEKANIPLLLVDREVEPLNYPLVTTDNEEATKSLAEIVLKENYEKIVVISEPLKDILTREIRYASVEDVVKTNNRKIQLIETIFDNQLKEQILELVSYPEKTAIFASNGRVLMETLTVLINEKIKIPENIGVVGFDDWKLSALVGPGITSVEQQTQTIGSTAGSLMLSFLTEKQVEKKTTIVPAVIEIRKSL